MKQATYEVVDHTRLLVELAANALIHASNGCEECSRVGRVLKKQCALLNAALAAEYAPGNAPEGPALRANGAGPVVHGIRV